MAELFSPDPVLAAQAGSADGMPRFSLVVSDEVSGGWHSAAIVREVASPAFYLRSISASWPYVIARPRPSTRQRAVRFRPDQLSPARTSPTQKLVVNWGWQPGDDSTEQLRFYVKHRGPLWLWPKRKLAVRLRLKHQAPPHRRYLLHVASEPIDWRPQRPMGFVTPPGSSPAQG